MQNSQDLLRDYIDSILKLREEEGILSDLFDDDIISSQDEGDLMNKKEYKLLTIINLKDNPDITFNTTARQPNYLKTKDSGLGTGILCYKENALNILKKTIDSDQRIIRINIKIQSNEVLNLLGYSKQKEMLKAFYNNLIDIEKDHIDSDEAFINYVCKKSNPKYKAVAGLTVLGDRIYPKSNIMDYIDTAICLKTEDIITKAELVR